MFYQIPSSMPWRAAAEIMVKRGECANFGEAAAKIRAQRRKPRSAPRSAFASAASSTYRLPYADN